MMSLSKHGPARKTGLFFALARFAAWGLAAFALTACAAALARTQTAAGVPWSYSGDTGPDSWYLLDPSYAAARDGKAQSPIAIDTADLTAKAGVERPAVSYRETAFTVENNGRTIELTPAAEGNAVSIDGETYALRQFHFHAPSEHSIDGAFFAMETHLVHENAAGALAVLALLVAEGPANKTLAALFDHLPAAAGEETEVVLNPAELFTGAVTARRYDGSLTTPPCTEGVKWTVYTPPVTLSAAQIHAFVSLYNGNKRPIQDRHGRPVYTAE
jgi:carbonic anhydrase